MMWAVGHLNNKLGIVYISKDHLLLLATIILNSHLLSIGLKKVDLKIKSIARNLSILEAQNKTIAGLPKRKMILEHMFHITERRSRLSLVR